MIQRRTNAAVITNVGIGGTVWSTHPDTNYDKLGIAALVRASTTNGWSTVDTAVTNLIGLGQPNYSAHIARAKTLAWASIDFVIFMGGTNDGANGCPLGTSSDSTRATVRGAIIRAAADIWSVNPACRLYFVTPIHRARWAGGNVDVDTVNNVGGYTMVDLVNAISDQAQRLKSPCYDANRQSGINAFNIATECSDGVHPNLGESNGEGPLGFARR